MPTSSKSRRRGHGHKGKTGRLAEKSASFHGQSLARRAEIRRPKTLPDLLSCGNPAGMFPEMPARLTKLLVNVTVQRSLGAVQVVMAPESTVGELVAVAVRLYSKEGRRPFLPTTDPSEFHLHYSQFSLESLDREEKLITLGSRNFFLCPVKPTGTDVMTTSPSSSRFNQSHKFSKIAIPFLGFMDFLL